MMRRTFIAGLGSAAAWPMMARAQQQTKATIGWLAVRPGGPSREVVEVFRQGLVQVGLSEGRDVTIEYRTTDGHPERLPAITADLIQRRPAAIVAPTGGAALAAKAATQTIPIIFGVGNDPVELGLVVSLNHPGGNLTGIASLGTEVAAKRLELLHKAVPGTESITMLLGRPDSVFSQAEARSMQSAARALGLRLRVVNVTADAEITAVFATLAEQRTGAVVVSAGAGVGARRDQILTLGARFALPTMFSTSLDARAGAPFSYGPDVGEMMRQVGIYTGRILKGEKPADLPVVQPTKFEFVINLRTAKALGFRIPADVLALADEVIE
jgi:putative ABC transport system substrate-binding protein